MTITERAIEVNRPYLIYLARGVVKPNVSTWLNTRPLTTPKSKAT